MSQERIGRYLIERVLGRGGMGTVYLAFDPRLEVRRAIKVMNTGEVDESYDRFLLEARAAVKLNHPNIVSIYDLDEDRKRPYIVMEYVEGEDLKVLIERRDFLPFDQKLDIVVKICNGLNFAHERGVLHRDVKPGNIRITPLGEVKILDFGLARLESSELTRTGRPMGTAYYMSTEQAKGRGDIDGRSDLYSVGVVLYELLTYRKPFDYEEDTSWPAILLTNLNDPHVPLLRVLPGCAEELGTVIDRVLAKDREARYRSCAELAEALRAFQQLLPPKQRDLVQSVEALETEFKRYRTENHKLLEWFGPALFENDLSENFQQTQPRGFPAGRASWKADYGYLLQRQQWLQLRKEEIAQKIDEALPMESLLENGRQRMARGDLDGCMQAVEKVLQRFPSHPGTLNLRAECESLREVRQQEDTRRQRVQRALEDARLAFEQGKFPQCFQAVSRVLQIDPENAEASALKNLAVERMERRRKVQELVAEARAYCKGGNWEACCVAVEKGLEIEPQHFELIQFREKARHALQARVKVDDLLCTARDLSQDHDYVGSLAAIDEALRLEPGDSEALKLQQLVVEAMQRRHEFDELLSTARGYHTAGDDEACLQTAEQALALDPKHAELQELKRGSQVSLERRNRLLDLSSDVRRRMEKRDFGRALEAIEELLRLDPRHSQALEWQQQARKELAHTERMEALLVEARRCLQEGDYAACCRIAAEGLELDASHAELKRLLQKAQEVLERPGRVESLLEKGKEELAQKDYSRVLRTVADLLNLEPENRNGLELQKVALDALDRFRKAEDLLAKARSRKKAGDDVGCYELASQAMKLAPDFPGLLELFQQAERNVEEKHRIDELLEKARAELARQNFQSALKIAEELLSFSRGNPDGLELKHVATESLQRQARFEKLLSQGRKYRQEGAYEDCFRISDEALQIEPDHDELRQIHEWAGAAIQKQQQVDELLGRVLKQLEQGELGIAIEGCSKILELEPAHPQAVALQREAVEAQQRRLKLQESLSAGKKAFHSRDYEVAYRIALQGLDLDPDHEELLKLREDAYQALEKPRKVKALMATVGRQIQNQDYEGAQQTIQIVLGIEPQNNEALELKLQTEQLRQRHGQLKELLAEALAYEKAGNDSACLQIAAKALQLDPANGQLRKLHEAARARLDKRRRVQELLEHARQLKQKKQFSVVLSTAEELLVLDPQLAEAVALKSEAVEFLARQREIVELLARARGCSRAGDLEGCYEAATAGLKLEPDHEELQQLCSSAVAVLENKRRRKVLLGAALQHRERSEHDTALKLLEELLSLDPKDAEVLMLKQQSTAALERHDQIQMLLRKANEYKQIGEFEACLRAAEQGLKLDSQNSELRELVSVTQDAIANASKIASWLDQARKSFEERRFREALESLQQVLMLQPDHGEAVELQRQAFDSLDRKQKVEQALAAARGYQKAKDYQACLKAAEQGLELDSEHVELKRLHDWACQGVKRLEKEEQLLQMARQSLESQNLNEALRLLKELLMFSPGHAQGTRLQREVMEAIDQGRTVEELFAAARSYYRVEDHEACVQVCKEALALQPTNKEFQELLRTSNEALELQRRITGLLGQARVERQRQDNRAALETLESLLELDPNHLEGFQLHRQAQEAYQREQNVQSLLAQARQYFQAGDYAASQKAIAGGLEVDPDHAELKELQERVRQASETVSRVRALLKEAQTFLDNRDFQRALQASQQLLSLQPEHAEAQQLRQRALDLLERQAQIEELMAAVRGYLQSRDYETSRKLALDALKLDPGHAELGRLLESAETGLNQRERVNQLLLQARQHLEKKDPVAVLKILDELFSLSPGNSAALDLQRLASVMRDQRRKFEELLAAARGFRKRGDAEACYRVCSEALTLEPENAELQELRQESFQVLEVSRGQKERHERVKQLEGLARNEVEARRFRPALRTVRQLLELEPAHIEALALKHQAEKGLTASRKRIGRWIAYAAMGLSAAGLGGFFYLSREIGSRPADESILGRISALAIPQSETWPKSYPRYSDEGNDPKEELTRMAAIQAQSRFRQVLALAERENIDRALPGGLRHARQLGSDAEQKMQVRDFGGARVSFDAASAEINRISRTVADKGAQAETAERAGQDEQRIREVLDRYRIALLGRDLRTIRKLWPKIPSEDENRLNEYFNASKIAVSVEVTSLNIFEGQRAQVRCRQQIETDRGSFKTRPDFRLERRGQTWEIIRKLE